MIVAVEDVLSEAVLRKTIFTVRPDVQVATAIGQRGKGYLKAKARELNRTAVAVPVILLVDQDSSGDCPPSLITSWFGGTRSRRLLFSVAVMEIESWVLAHRSALATLLSIPEHRIPLSSDDIQQPKEFLVNLARQSRSKTIREDFVPAPGSTATVGPAYNLRLTRFVEATWSPTVAAQVSASLARTLERLKEFAI